MAITVLLVDDHDLIREGLRRAFERESDFEVVGEANDIESAIDMATKLEPQVVIIDIRLPDGSGLDATRKMRASAPGLGIVVLTMYAGDQHLFDALDAGASAFVPKSAPADDVISAARHAATSPTSFSAGNLADAMRRRLDPASPKLSPREMEVLALLKDGLAIGTIARRLYISESTAKSHVSKVYDKLGAANRAQAIMAAVRLGLISSETET